MICKKQKKQITLSPEKLRLRVSQQIRETKKY